MAAKRSTRSSKSKKEKAEKELEVLEELEDQDLDELDDEDLDDDSPSIFSNPKFIYGFIILAALIFVLWQVKSVFVAATVNNQPISRAKLVRELETRYGEQVLDTLITQKLVEQAANEQNITVTDEEINQQIEEIRTQVELQGSTLEDALAMQGQTEENLREGVRYSIMVEKLFEGQAQVTEEEVRAYYDQNQEFYGEETTYEDVSANIREQMVQQQLSGRFQQWLMERRDEATIRQFVNF